MIFYAVSTDEPQYFGTQAEAFSRAREFSGTDEAIEFFRDGILVERIEVPTDRATVLRMINCGGGFVTDSKIIARFRGGKRIR